MKPRRRSLVGELFGWTLGALAVVWLGVVAIAFRTGVHEAGELTDGHLASVAALLLAQREGEFAWRGDYAPAALASTDLRSHDYQQSMSIVVWDAAGRVVARTGEAPLPSFGAAEGFAELRLGDPPSGWRTFSRWDDAGHTRKLMVLLSVGERDELVLDIALQMALPTLLLLPLVALALGLAIARGLKPLRALSDDLDALDVQHAALLGPRHPHREFDAVVGAINALVGRQQAALKAERELASELAHELRTPLASLALHARSLDEAGTADPAERDASLAQVRSDALRAGDVLQHLLALARASRAEWLEASEPVDVTAIARGVVAEYAQPSVESGHELALVADGAFEAGGHRALIEMALRNLIDNALCHTPAGTLVEVQVDAARRWLQVCDDGGARSAADAREGHDRPPTTHRAMHSRRALGWRLGHRVVEKIAAIHGARFEHDVPPPEGFTACYRLAFPTPGSPAALPAR